MKKNSQETPFQLTDEIEIDNNDSEQSLPNNNLNKYNDENSQSQQLQLNQTQSFDDILTKIGFGKYTIGIFILMGLIGMTDGAEAQNLSLVLPIMEQKKVWGISDNDEGILGSCVFGGYFLGSFLSGKLADSYGRKLTIQYSSILLFIFSLASSFSPIFVVFIIIRSIFGILVGFIVPISFTILAENVPTKQRGALLVCIGVFYTLGELLTCLLSLITMKNLKEAKYNSSSYRVTDSANDMHDIKKWAEESNDIILDKGDFKSLFQGKFKYVTPIIWYNWFVSSFVYFGITFILPLTLADGESTGKEDLWTITVSALGELPTLFVVAVAVHIPYLGRKNTWGISYGLGFLALLLVYFEVSFTFFIAVSKLALDMAFTLSYEYTGEIYPTRHRAKGLGMAGAYSRIGGILMPWVGIYISKIGKYLPYLIFGITSLIASIITFILPFETRNQQLDRFQ